MVDSGGQRISVVIPALNEAQAIVQTVEGARAALADRDHEIIVVDDGSNVSTGDLARRAGARVIRHDQTQGYGRSLKDGIESASGDTIVITDADGTYPLDAVPRLVAAYQKGADMVVGARRGEHYRESAMMVALRALLKMLVLFAAGHRVADVNSGLRVFSRTASRAHFPHLCDTFSFTTSLTLTYLLTGRSVLFVPIAYHRRVGQRKVRLLADSLRTLGYIATVSWRYRPLSVCAKVAALVLLVVGAVAVAVAR